MMLLLLLRLLWVSFSIQTSIGDTVVVSKQREFTFHGNSEKFSANTDWIINHLDGGLKFNYTSVNHQFEKRFEIDYIASFDWLPRRYFDFTNENLRIHYTLSASGEHEVFECGANLESCLFGKRIHSYDALSDSFTSSINGKFLLPGQLDVVCGIRIPLFNWLEISGSPMAVRLQNQIKSTLIESRFHLKMHTSDVAATIGCKFILRAHRILREKLDGTMELESFTPDMKLDASTIRMNGRLSYKAATAIGFCYEMEYRHDPSGILTNSVTHQIKIIASSHR